MRSIKFESFITCDSFQLALDIGTEIREIIYLLSLSTITVTFDGEDSERVPTIHKNGWSHARLWKFKGLHDKRCGNWLFEDKGLPFTLDISSVPSLTEIEDMRTDNSETFAIVQDGIYELEYDKYDPQSEWKKANVRKFYLQENGVLTELDKNNAIPTVRRLLHNPECITAF